MRIRLIKKACYKTSKYNSRFASMFSDFKETIAMCLFCKIFDREKK